MGADDEPKRTLDAEGSADVEPARLISQSSGSIALCTGATAAVDRYFGGLSCHRPLTSGDAWTARLRFGGEF